MQGYGYGPPPGIRQEVTFFEGQGVQVTSARFTAFGQLYPISNITSVAPFTVPTNPLRFILWAAVLGLIALCSLGGRAYAVALLFGVGAGLVIWRAVAQKTTYGIMITTAGMQVRAMTSHDFTFVQQVLAALHQAVASR